MLFLYLLKIAVISVIIGYGLSNKNREKYLKEKEKRIDEIDALQEELKLWEYRYNKECLRSEAIIKENMGYRNMLGLTGVNEIYSEVINE